MYIITQHLGEDFDYGAKSNLEAFFISLKKTNQIIFLNLNFEIGLKFCEIRT